MARMLARRLVADRAAEDCEAWVSGWSADVTDHRWHQRSKAKRGSPMCMDHSRYGIGRVAVNRMVPNRSMRVMRSALPGGMTTARNMTTDASGNISVAEIRKGSGCSGSCTRVSALQRWSRKVRRCREVGRPLPDSSAS